MKNLSRFAVLAAAALTAPATAAPSRLSEHQVRVSTAGLDLRSEAGAKSLELRIVHAATELCGQPSSLDALGWKKAQRCRDDARAAATAQLDATVALARNPGRDTLASAR
jgi:UrcA family protein